MLNVLFKTARLLLPVLIPSWRFFDEIAPSPRLEYRLLDSRSEEIQAWQTFQAIPQQLSIPELLKRLLYNPTGNERLYMTSCAERLMETVTEHSEMEINKRIIHHLRRTFTGKDRHCGSMQFRIRVIQRTDSQLQEEIVFISAIHTLQDEHLS